MEMNVETSATHPKKAARGDARRRLETKRPTYLAPDTRMLSAGVGRAVLSQPSSKPLMFEQETAC
ncbi:MAG: hypothetical protein B7Z37_22850 [Verrucomicrobia bacterium 12-59-8]|nr:MAG: hypothetical protein B7Z37_22850 [Verrucomicrobia bacterium 12-59-8]